MLPLSNHLFSQWSIHLMQKKITLTSTEQLHACTLLIGIFCWHPVIQFNRLDTQLFREGLYSLCSNPDIPQIDKMGDIQVQNLLRYIWRGRDRRSVKREAIYSMLYDKIRVVFLFRRSPVLRIRIRDPGLGAFWPLDPGSGIRDPE